MIAAISEYAKKYKEDGSLEALNELYEYFDNHTVYFSKFYTDTNGGKTVNADHNLNGKFEEFATSTNFPTPDLLRITTDRGETVYVLLSDLIDQEL